MIMDRMPLFEQNNSSLWLCAYATPPPGVFTSRLFATSTTNNNVKPIRSQAAEYKGRRWTEEVGEGRPGRPGGVAGGGGGMKKEDEV